jgi:hypothetical protein
MLLRDAHAAGFRVPETPRRPIEADTADAERDRKQSAALDERNARDTRLADRLEGARAQARFAKLIASAEASGEAGEGLTARIAKELRKLKMQGGLSNDGFATVETAVRGRAMKAEAEARAKDRIGRIGATIDTLVAATKAAPENFAAHVETAEQQLARLDLPETARALFRERLTDIPAAALSALAERAPDVAVDLIKRREGPAATRYGLSRTALRLIAKQADSAIANTDVATTHGATIKGTRAYADARAAIADAERGDAPESALTAWLPHAAVIGRNGARELQDLSGGAAETFTRKKSAAAEVRTRLAAGETLDPNDPAHVEGADAAYAERPPQERATSALAFAKSTRIVPASLARELIVRLKGDDLEAAAEAARTIATLAREDNASLARLDPGTVREALAIDTLQNAGLAPADAVRRFREGADVPIHERDRRTRDFDRRAGGRDIAAIIERLFGTALDGIAEA